ncbi:MAG: AhpC/TSA family protein [Leptospirales bacterium]|nr:AhpC/TSA family protein [Leptospirales bacterium]
MNLQSELSKFAEQLQQNAPPERIRLFETFVGALQKSGITTLGPKKGEQIGDFEVANVYSLPAGRSLGERIPNFSLRDHMDRLVRLSDFLSKGPVVLSFYRGNWCPACNIELRALQHNLPRFKEAGAQLVAISNESPDQSITTAEKLQLEFAVLSDPGGRVARQFKLLYQSPGQERFFSDVNIAAHNADSVARFVIPATYVIDQNYVVRYAFADANFLHRADIEEVIAALQSIAAGAPR